jgi:hypothetical protein
MLGLNMGLNMGFENELNNEYLHDNGINAYTRDNQFRSRDSKGKQTNSHSISLVESVFGNIGTNKKLKRFNLSGKNKVQSQWYMFCLIYNIEKLKNYGQLAA